VRRSIQRILENAGYQVLAAASGEEAEKLGNEHLDEISVLITDVVMAGMNGRELFERLQPRKPALRILYISGYAADVIGMEGGLNSAHFIQKPFAPQELIDKVRELMA